MLGFGVSIQGVSYFHFSSSQGQAAAKAKAGAAARGAASRHIEEAQLWLSWLLDHGQSTYPHVKYPHAK